MTELLRECSAGMPTRIFSAPIADDETLDKFRELYRAIREIETKSKYPCGACESRNSDSCLCEKSIEYTRMLAYVDGAHWAAGYMLNRGQSNCGGGGFG